VQTSYVLRPRARFAADPTKGRGRRIPEAPSTTRTEYQRDRDRILHSAAFRRLKDKTQVFMFDEDDHHRTRLTHTLEVAQIARSIGRVLGLDDDLCEALALAHDLGHTPFGHAGERALEACMQEHGGFDHNAQSLRIVCRLERRYAEFDGLNLTWETLEGLAKHNGPLTGNSHTPGSEAAIAACLGGQDLWLWSHASAEAQVAAIADDIAYDTHDLDDGMRAGLFALEDLDAVACLRPILAEVQAIGPLERPRAANELVRRFIGALVEDVIAESSRRLTALAPGSADDIRRAEGPVIGFSPTMAEADREVKAFLFQRMYRHADVMLASRAAEKIVRDLFGAYRDKPDLLPPEWQAEFEAGEGIDKARTLANFIAGMTDRYALAEHRRLFDAPAVLV
jgi:dGTPase